MCGIAGLFYPETPKPVDPGRVQRMSDALAHRGPDGSGVWVDRGIGLGHRRLAIIDLEGGAQPMATPEGRYHISFNGEIYNFAEVRKELEAAGDVFETDSDTEVILLAWRRWGRAAIDRLNGMFAFALYDREEHSLTLVRDRLGVKPLFYTRLPDGAIAFASELKGLLANPALRRVPDEQVIESYMTWGYVPDDQCIVRGVQKLPAGHSIRFSASQPDGALHRYWDVSFAERSSAKPAVLEEELLELMRDAVRLRMISDVPLGAFLSGGVDSSSVVALMAERSKSAVTSCSIGFDEASLDETSHARAVAKRFATDHHEEIVTAGDFALIDRLVDQFDEPFADGSALPTAQVCALARRHVTVALSGDGADEALAGYRRHVFHHGEERVRSLLPLGFRQSVFGTLGRLYPKADWAPRPLRAKTTLLALANDGDAAYADALSVTGAAHRQALYSPELGRALQGHRAEQDMISLMRQAPARSGLDRAQYADLKVWLPGDILTKVDRSSMAVSLEAREPLLDYRLIEFAARLPEKYRIQSGQGKWLLKKSMERYLPEDILYRPKMGFVTPISQWFRGPLADTARGIADGDGLARTGWFNGKAMTDMAEAHISGRSDYGRTLWQLVMLDKAMKKLFAL
ncbi:XrtA/PEP-CTERM system amidotransferase [Alterisphingorhabdus coralli]|uniref:asparagine synthase (glutamine-hydrolyzing) n=1 Tax=Alterisphingorhabdus coralli TaxID=3071408 RepID=A0AA97F4B4_9SPHN|nr:XrtA/PEP-CTERM system amidotransferase [Parasphingorhabdus sp. SCSIO 66989]WOE73786.1 amidotransferase 1, exosortase A system-associated [Parasphingorhabdus sp. SCSIO 66989]